MSDRPGQALLLIDAVCEGRASDADRERLWEMMRSDESVRQLYAEYMNTHAQLQWKMRETVDPGPPVIAAPEPETAPGVAGRIGGIGYAAAAAVLAAAAALVIYAYATDPGSEPQPPGADAPVATLIDATGDVIVNDDVARTGTEYGVGRYAMASGSAELLLTNRVAMRINGLTELSIESPMRATLHRGAGSFVCPPGMIGFTVNLPGGAKVVDLGTAFRIRVNDDGDSAVVVTDGIVRVESAARESVLVKRGEAMTVPLRGDVVRDVDVTDRASPGGDAYAIAVESAQPAAYWRFDRDGEGRFVNRMGPAHTLDPNGTATDDPSRPAAILSGDPLGGLEAPTMRSEVSGDAYTIELWMRADAFHTGSLMSIGPGGVYLGIEGDAAPERGRRKIRFVHRDLGQSSGGAEVRAPYAAGAWHHLAAVRSDSGIALYVDGRLAGQADHVGDWPVAPSRVLIGRLRPVGDDEKLYRPFRGRLDEIAIYPRALDAREIETHYLMGVPAATAPEDAEKKRTPGAAQ